MIKYRHTISGLISKIYNHQKQTCEERNYTIDYTFKELKEWVLKQAYFYELYDNWEKSNYKTNLSPSCDRIDDYKGYFLNNLRLTTWIKNKRRYYNDVKNGINRKLLKSTIQFNKDGSKIKEYYSIAQAERETKIAAQSIGAACKGKLYTAGGFIWKYKNN